MRVITTYSGLFVSPWVPSFDITFERILHPGDILHIVCNVSVENAPSNKPWFECTFVIEPGQIANDVVIGFKDPENVLEALLTINPGLTWLQARELMERLEDHLVWRHLGWYQMRIAEGAGSTPTQLQMIPA